MIVYPLSKTEARIVRYLLPGICCVAVLTFTALGIREILDWIENLVPLFAIGIEA